MATGDGFSPADSTGFLLDRVAHHLSLRVQEFLDAEGVGLSAQQVGILTVVAHLDEPLRMAELADLLGRDPTTLTRQIEGLERAGLAQRSRDPSDRRAVIASATPAGVHMVERTMPLTLALRRRAMRGISQADENVLADGLRRMLKNLRE